MFSAWKKLFIPHPFFESRHCYFGAWIFSISQLHFLLEIETTEIAKWYRDLFLFKFSKAFILFEHSTLTLLWNPFAKVSLWFSPKTTPQTREKGYSLLVFFFSFFAARVYFSPRWPSRCSDWKCLLGVVLLGAWNSAWWSDAERQNHRRWRWFFQHVFRWNRCRKTRTTRSVRRSGTNCCW